VSYFRDLTTYNYALDKVEEDGCVLNVGWLSLGEPLPVGTVPADALERLLKIAENPVRVMRGFHFCEFCLCDDVNDRPKGTGEIRVTSKSGITYAAPVLICHYINEHNYLPPQEFLDTLME